MAPLLFLWLAHTVIGHLAKQTGMGPLTLDQTMPANSNKKKNPPPMDLASLGHFHMAEILSHVPDSVELLAELRQQVFVDVGRTHNNMK